ncbi:MAG: membrane protein insertase YidC [Candidatus Doudnabacteria bacterium]|nr:membrane protein insertase YidC [Candidatus Doudnabacteria bacterium]
MISDFFNQILVYPLLNLLVFFYNFIPDIGAVIILVTVLVRLALLPSFHKSLRHQKALSDLQPKMNEIKEKYKDNKEQQAKAMMELYSTHKVNPLSSCLPLLIQLPILIALYQVFIQSLNGANLQGIYSFVPRPEHIDPMFLGLINLKDRNVWMPALAAALQYFQSRLSLPKVAGTDQMSKIMSMQTLYMFPIFTFFIGLQFPAGLTLYWIVTTLFGIAQQYYILRKETHAA